MKCDLCNKEVGNLLQSTSFTDAYCKDCLQLVIYECEQALLDIEDKEKWEI